MANEVDPRTESWGIDALPAPADSSTTRLARRARRLRRSPVALACAFIALTCVGLAARRAFASDETKIRWLLEEMLDDFNAGDTEAALLPFWKREPYRKTRPAYADALELARAAGELEPRPRLEHHEAPQVELFLDDSVDGAIATGEVLLVEGRDPAEPPATYRVRAYLGRFSIRAPWRIPWQVTSFEYVRAPAELPPVPR